MRHLFLFFTIIAVLFWAGTFPGAQESKQMPSHPVKYRFFKPFGQQDRRQGIHSGNLIRTLFFNYGTIGYPYATPAVEWPKGSDHNYIFEFGVIVAAEVVDAYGDTVHIVSDGIIGGIAGEGGDVSPTGEVWGWQPLPGYAAPDQPGIAMNDKPETWPDRWPNRPDHWGGYWIGEYGKGLAIADQESYYVMDDRENKEFAYYPDTRDSSRGGIGVQVEVRGYQWSHPLAEDCIFWVFEITNVGDKDLEKVVFGMYGDADVGGAEDWNDDDSYFDIDRDMVYQWDHDNRGIWGGPVGYFGFKYLESPGNPFDGIDNDGDGMVDERRDDGIDNDGDWNPDRDDVGADGIPNTHDEGEGDGKPTPGEPNFDETDIDESDQIGLTSFSAFVWPTVRVSDDEEMWRRLTPGNFPQPPQNVDIVFLYGSGYFPLKAGQTQRFSIALLLGEDKEDLFRNADVVQKIYNSNYHFAKAPDKPTVYAVPGDGRVTLYWDSKAELSWDPISGEDFEGYRIYRSTDPGFNEAREITDGQGNLQFLKPIAQFDLKNGIKGFHPVDVNGVKYYLGDDTGLRHSFTDTTVVNGVTYYYAVVSYDRGDTLALIPPTECPRVIDIDEAGNLKTDINTVIVTPRPAPPDYQPPHVENVQRLQGIGTGTIRPEIIDPYRVVDGAVYEIVFSDTLDATGVLAYQVREISSGTPVVKIKKSRLFNNEESNPVFDGIHLFVQEDSLQFDALNSGWINGESNYEFDGGLFHGGTPYPADYEIRFGINRRDDVFNLPVPFEVWNVTNNTPARFGLVDNDNSGDWTPGDDIVMLIGDSGVNPSWYVRLLEPSDGQPPRSPQDGDVFRLATRKPFASGDVFRFQTQAGKVGQKKDPSILDFIRVVPNPYVATNILEPATSQVFGRRERRLMFVNVPSNATIRIYTITGNLVQTLHNSGQPQDGIVTWDLLTRDRLEVAFGVYVYHVEVPGVGEKIGKFAIIK